MMNFFKSIIFNRFVAQNLIHVVLSLHSFLYKLLTKFAIVNNKGVHPKHEIIKYEQWFFNNIDDGWVVLDIGSNYGKLSQYLSKKASYVYGIEIEQKHVNKAISLNQRTNVSYICADATEYLYDDMKNIDCIVLSNVLEHIENRVEFLNSMMSKNIWNDNKYILIRVPMIDRDWVVQYKQSLGLEYRLDTTHFIEYTLDNFVYELKEAGISIKSYSIKYGEIYAVCEGNIG